jgi:cold shock CspA family protein
MPKGTIIRAREDKGFAFALDDETFREVFLHRVVFPEAVSFREIAGTRIEYTAEETPKGLRAQSARIIDDGLGRERGTIERLTSHGGFIEPFQPRGIYFNVEELVGNDWPADLHGVPVTYTVHGDDIGRPIARAVRKEN